MDLSTALIWVFRVLLPVILFFIYFKSQTQKDGDDNAHGYGGGLAYTIAELLEAREQAGPCAKPRELATLSMADPSRAPHLFSSAPARQGRGPGGGGKGQGRRQEDSSEGGDGSRPLGGLGSSQRDGDAGVRVGRESPPARDRNATATADREKHQGDHLGEVVEDDDPLSDADAAPAAAAAASVAYASEPKVELGEPEDSAANTLALIHFLAFRPGQQRHFLLEGPPPAPPRRAVAEDHSAYQVEKANSEARSVLQGAAVYKRSDVAMRLHEHLSASHVAITAPTYSLMVETCVTAKDLESASHLLMKMEAAGHHPDGELLDQVMDLYPVQNATASSSAMQGVSFADDLPDDPLSEMVAEEDAEEEAPAPGDADVRPHPVEKVEEEDFGDWAASASASKSQPHRWSSEADRLDDEEPPKNFSSEAESSEPAAKPEAAPVESPWRANGNGSSPSQPRREKQTERKQPLSSTARPWREKESKAAEKSVPPEPQQPLPEQQERASESEPPLQQQQQEEEVKREEPQVTALELHTLVPAEPGAGGYDDTPDMADMERQAPSMPSTPEMACMPDISLPEFGQQGPFAMDGMTLLPQPVAADGSFIMPDSAGYGMTAEGMNPEAFASLAAGDPQTVGATGEFCYQSFPGAPAEAFSGGAEYAMQQMQYCDSQGQYIFPAYMGPAGAGYAVAYAAPFQATLGGGAGGTQQQGSQQRTKLSSKAQMFVPGAKQ